MSSLRVGLDHVGLVVNDLEAARATYERLGFTLTPRSMHSGAVQPGGPVVAWGSGNHCAMFERGYFEILGLIDPNLHSSAKLMLRKYQGLHIVALDCESSEDAHAFLQARHVPTSAPLTLERDISYGEAGSERRTARFRNINLDMEQYPEAKFIVIEQCTRDVLWQHRLKHHPNGARALERIYLCCPNVEASVQRFAKILGTPVRQGDGYRFDLESGSLWFMSEASIRAVCPVMGDEIHRVAAACVAVESLDRLERFLAQRDIEFVRALADPGEPSIWVPPSEAGSCGLQFIQFR